MITQAPSLTPSVIRVLVDLINTSRTADIAHGERQLHEDLNPQSFLFAAVDELLKLYLPDVSDELHQQLLSLAEPALIDPDGVYRAVAAVRAQRVAQRVAQRRAQIGAFLAISDRFGLCFVQQYHLGVCELVCRQLDSENEDTCVIVRAFLAWACQSHAKTSAGVQVCNAEGDLAADVGITSADVHLVNEFLATVS